MVMALGSLLALAALALLPRVGDASGTPESRRPAAR
jgi:hypothetical protein